MLAALGRLVKEKPAGSAKLVVAFTVDEENGGLGVSELMASGVRADYAIVAEPTLLNIVNAHKGVARWHLETAGREVTELIPDPPQVLRLNPGRPTYLLVLSNTCSVCRQVIPGKLPWFSRGLPRRLRPAPVRPA